LYRRNQGVFFALYRFYQGQKFDKRHLITVFLMKNLLMAIRMASKKNTKKAMVSKKDSEDGDSVKKDLDEIIRKTEEQNRALRKVLKKERKTEKI